MKHIYACLLEDDLRKYIAHEASLKNILVGVSRPYGS